jgi:DNA-binding CsgD family transcriptional regulator
MEPDIKRMHEVWSNLMIANRRPTDLPQLNFDDLVSAVFSVGPCYHYIVDFYDMSIANMSPGFFDAHGIPPQEIKNINDILSLIHAEDMDFVLKAEEKALGYMYNTLTTEKITRYKASYNLRFRKADGSYGLFNHQSLILTMDENNNFIKSLNIHTDVSHLTDRNNYKVSLIGLMGEPSFLNMEVLDDRVKLTSENSFSKREIEIVNLIAAGCKTKEISEKLNIALDTVKAHRKNILVKSECKNMAELTAKSISEGWI